jgi:hypothetical protein
VWRGSFTFPQDCITTLAAIFFKPTLASIVFADIESLVKALGGTVLEREGSRVSVQLMGEEWRCHRRHPGKEAKATLNKPLFLLTQWSR